jgi:hypothetical protein
VATDSRIMSHSSCAPRPRLLYSLCPTVKDRVPASKSSEKQSGAQRTCHGFPYRRKLRFCRRGRKGGQRKTKCCHRRLKRAAAGKHRLLCAADYKYNLCNAREPNLPHVDVYAHDATLAVSLPPVVVPVEFGSSKHFAAGRHRCRNCDSGRHKGAHGKYTAGKRRHFPEIQSLGGKSSLLNIRLMTRCLRLP